MQNHYYNSNVRNSTVVGFARGDVNGDKIPDTVYVTGMKESDVSHADSLGFIQNRLKWNGSMFVLDYQDLAIFGSQAE
ncbi:hypothetical protein [Mesobacillus jeotgali]|uniref:hypothetical protein n=1 Tax=Mesobacillus jeotgali TaxID=129985 RepID=UPI001CFDE199|nr:hypothetical protein [Mesobacillus jeotgali]